MITYLVSPNNKPGSRLTPAQRSSSMYSDAPIVAGKILRRGCPVLKLSESQYKIFEPRINMLKKAGSITVTKVTEEPAATLTLSAEDKSMTVKTSDVKITLPIGFQDLESQDLTPAIEAEPKKKKAKKE